MAESGTTAWKPDGRHKHGPKKGAHQMGEVSHELTSIIPWPVHTL